MCNRFEPLSGRRHVRIDYAIEDQMPLVEGAFRTDKWDRAAPVLFEKF